VIGESTKQFRELILQKGQALRNLSYDALLALANTPTERVEFSGLRGAISLIVEPCPDDRLRVVDSGFLRRAVSVACEVGWARWLLQAPEWSGVCDGREGVLLL